MPADIAPPGAFFLPATHGARFCLQHSVAPDRPARGTILYIHPFGEELNCSRRIVARQCRALAAGGWQVLQIDLGGCGDSSGDLVEATIEGWRQDLRDALAWLGQRDGAQPVTLWGLRLGALLALDLAASEPRINQLILWQPVIDGAKFMGQFLRMGLAADFDQVEPRSDLASLRQHLAQRSALEIAGYNLGARLAREIEALCVPTTVTVPVAWLQLGSSATLVPASAKVIEQWRAAGASVLAECVPAPPFWSAPGYDQADTLLTATTGAVDRMASWT